MAAVLFGFPAASANVAPAEVPGSTRVAATPAEFRVDEQGAATWSMPIYAVPGTAGVSPNLRLAYSSGGGFGPVGKGFAIQGWSQITRCRASRESGDFRDAAGAPVDGEPLAVNFDTTRNSDEYCLDGQRLIHQAGSRGTNGAEYRLELEAFTRVILRDRDGLHGPDYFVVQRRDGSTSYYGDYDGCGAPVAGAACSFNELANRADARANANNDGLSRPEGQIFGLARSYDSHGNYMDWQWTSPGAGAVELLPGTVRYTGRTNLPGRVGPISQPYAEVRYLYEASPVLRKAYQGGSLSQLTRRLTTIQSVDASNQVIREYRLTYQAAPSGNLDYQVSQITECAISGMQETCLKPTMFTWSNASYTLSGGQERTDSTWQRMIDSKLGDVDGDGRLDLVWIAWVAPQGLNSCQPLPNGQLCARVNVAFGTTDLQGNFTFSSSIATGFYRRWPGNTTTLDYRKVPNRWALVDYDGDGRDDLMLHPDVPSSASASTQWALYLSTGSGFADQDQLGAVPMPTQIPVNSGPARSLEPNVQLSDLNGDGLVDVVYAVPVLAANQTTIAATVKIRLGTVVSDPAGSIFGPELDVAFDVESARAESCDALYVVDPDDPGQARLADLNGDGRMDWALTYRCESFPGSEARVQRQTMLPIQVSTVEGEPGTIVFRPALMAGGRVEGNQYVFRHYLVGRPDSPKWRSISNTSQFADVNGDALPDLIYHQAPSDTAEVWLNTGSAQRGFVKTGGLLSNIRDPQTVDFDGDGLSDLAYGTGNDQPYRWRRGTADGLGDELPIPGCQFGCLVRQVQGGQRWFADFDGDGAMEFVIVKPGDQNQNLTVVTGNPAHRHQARDVVTAIENGLGARTEIDYLPLTNRAVYRRQQFSRLDHDNNPGNDSTRFGRGSAVLDLMTPIYVVSTVSSPAPSLSDGQRRAVVHYRYAGAKLQGGGRGFLGFAEIATIDGNYTAADGTPQACPVGSSCHVMTVTRYHQDFPLIGRPRSTDQVILPEAFAPEACRGADRAKIDCATPAGTPLFPDPVSTPNARRLSYSGKSYSCWGSKQVGTTSTACAPVYSGSYCPVPLSVDGLMASRSVERVPAFQAGSVSQGVEVFVDGEDDVVVEPNSAAVTSQRFAVHCHDAGFANLRLSEEVHLAGGGFSIQHEVARVRSTFQHVNDTAKWHLGRLEQSQVLHQRKEAGQTTYVTETRKARFDYDRNSGQLKSETAHLEAGASAELRTYYDFDASGNRIATYSCSASVAESVCRNPTTPGNPLMFQPARVADGSTTLPNALVRRYSRVEFDATGRFPVKTWQPWFDPTVQPRQWTERVSSDVLARDRYGEVTQARDANGLLSYAARDGLGREYWTSTSAGTSTLKTLHWCTGRNGGQHEVSCPAGPFVFRTEVRQIAAAGGAQVGPSQWTYHDVLGRVLMTVTEAFDGNGVNKDLSAVCVDHDPSGRPTRQTEPFFLTGASPPTFAPGANACVNATGSTTAYDVTGRVKRQRDAVGAATELWHRAVNLTVNSLAVSVAELEKRAPCNRGVSGPQCTRIWKERRDAAGKLIESEDPAGTIVRYGYTAAGDVQTVSRRATATSPAVVTTTQFDVAGRKISQTDPDSGIWTWQYNAAGEVIRQVDGAGRVVDTERDALGRVWRRTTEATTAPSDALLKDGFEGSAVLLRQVNQELVDLFVYDTAPNGLGQLHWSQREEPGLMNHQVTLSYDGLGRVAQRVTQIEGRNYTESFSFDSVGRPLKQLMSYQEPLASGAQLYAEGSETAYSVRGHAVRTCRATTLAGQTGCIGGTLYHELLETDARGAVLREVLAGNAQRLTTTRSYDAVGRVDRVQTGLSNDLQHWDYDFDAAGNLQRRQNLRAGHALDETFGYDLLDRLAEVKQGSVVQMGLSYDGLGSVCSKTVSGVAATYTTGLGSGCATTDPTRSVHQVADAQGWRYTYNANGDVTQRLNAGVGRGLSIEYDAHRGIRRLELVQTSTFTPLEASEFRLDSGDQRYQRRDFTSSTLTRITTYVGSLERIEHLVPQNGVDREARLTLGSVIVTTKWSGATRTDQQRYVLRDHLGSADVIVRPDGVADETLSFDAHGRRRNASSFAYLLSYTDTTTRRGYTGHEHLDALGLVHMNARIYDPILGRFLQADTLIEADATQGLNRYTYVLNNALVHTDPTGRSLSPMARTFLSVFATIVMPGIGASAFGLGSFGQVVFAGFVSGSISGGLKGGVIGAFSAGLFHGIGSTFNTKTTPWAFTGGSMNIAGRMAKTVAHGTAGGVMQELQGGKFGHGFVSAAAPELLHPQIGKLPASPVRILSAALVGGSVSSATGGKFASGAITAAFMWAFNHEQHERIFGDGAENPNRDVVFVKTERDGVYPFDVYIMQDSEVIAGPYRGSIYPDQSRSGCGSGGCPTAKSGSYSYSLRRSPGGWRRYLGLFLGDVETVTANLSGNARLEGHFGRNVARGVFVHPGARNSTTSEGCLTVTQSDYNDFISNFPRGASGSVHILPEWAGAAYSRLKYQ